MEKLQLSYSRIRNWRFCRQSHYYKYIEKLEPRRKKVALYRGTIIHEMIQAWVSGGSWEEVLDTYTEQFNNMFDEEKADMGDLPQECRTIMEGYVQQWADDGLEYLEVEYEPEPVPMFDDIDFMVKVDGIAQDRNGRIWLVEHKTHKTFPSEDVRFADYQTLIYAWALFKRGSEIDGIMWDYIRTKPPTKPRLLKNGTLSKAQNIDTTHDVYLKTIHEHGLDPKDYEDILDKLYHQTEKFYRRVFVPFKWETVNMVVEDVAKSALEIKRLQHIPIRELSNWQCPSCDYFSLCSAELLGLDASFIKKADYKPRRGRNGGTSKEKDHRENS